MGRWKAEEGWQKRNTLKIVGFIGLALMYSLRFNLSIGIVAMVEHAGSHDHKGKNTSDAEICPALIVPNSNGTSVSQEDVNSGQVKFDWNEKEQGLILGSFFWGYMLTQFPGGVLAQQHGGKWVISLGLLLTGILSLILPYAAILGGFNFVVLVRVLQGICQGVVFPAFTVLIGKWTAPSERASVAAVCFNGMPFGTAATMIASGYLISSFGWPAVFYVPGILTIVWFFAWTYLIYSSPNEHPTITARERNVIEKAKKEEENADEEILGFCDIPWRKILMSMPFWAIMIAHFSNTWGHNTIKSEGNKFLHSVLHFDIHSNAYVAATPYLCGLLFSNLSVGFADYMVSKRWISLITARRLCNTIGQMGSALAFAGLILADCDRSLVILFFILTGTFNGAVYGGFIVNHIDIAPNLAGVLEGVINGVANIAGFGAPYIAGLILHNEPSINGWRYVFIIPIIANIIGNIVFVLFCSTTVQTWNNKRKDEKRAGIEKI